MGIGKNEWFIEEINRCCKLSCDESIIKTMDRDEKKTYGDTLLNSLKAMGNYSDKLAAVTLTEGAEQLKERLDAIMEFKKKSKATVVITFVLTTILCVGAAAVGAYAATPTNQTPASPKENTENQPKPPITAALSPTADGNLTLVTKEYSMADIKLLNISGIVIEVLSENVSITRGGETLKVEYYIRNQDNYTLKNESDAGETFEELVLRRVTSAIESDTKHPISVTIPDEVNFKMIAVTTSGGNISLKDCGGENIILKTQNGDIIIDGGYTSSVFAIDTESGNAIVSDFSVNKYGIDFKTKSGTITFNGVDYEVNTNTAKKEGEIGISPEVERIAAEAERYAEYDAKYDAGDISEAEREAYNSVSDIVRKAVLEAHQDAHPGVSFEDCPECNSFN